MAPAVPESVLRKRRRDDDWAAKRAAAAAEVSGPFRLIGGTGRAVEAPIPIGEAIGILEARPMPSRVLYAHLGRLHALKLTWVPPFLSFSCRLRPRLLASARRPSRGRSSM